jgi:CelD/BcsL family acetyltransferase involved in cellulose biosynthesis
MAIARQYLHPEELPAALVTSRAEVAAASGAIADLAAAASDANPFFEPAFLVQSLDLAKDDWAVFLAGDAVNRLIGLFPFARTRTAPGFEALTSLVLPHSPHGYLGTPLLRAGREAEAIDGLLDALELGALGCLLLDFRLLARDSAAYAALRGRLAARGQPWIDLGRRDRAMFRPRESAEAYLSAALSHAKRRKLGQRQRQLERLGRLSYRRLERGEDATPWVDAFLALERSGWKGEQGTALACSPKDERFFRQAAAGFHADGRLLMYGLWLDERPVALHAAFLDARTRAESAAFKIAYDEAYAKQSPGVLLEVWAIGEQHGPRPLAARVDTCAWSGNPLWNELLLDRRELAHLMVGPRGPAGRMLVEGLRLGRRLKEQVVRLRARQAG